MEVECGLRGWSVRWGARVLGGLAGLCVPRVLLGRGCSEDQSQRENPVQRLWVSPSQPLGIALSRILEKKKFPLPI